MKCRKLVKFVVFLLAMAMGAVIAVGVYVIVVMSSTACATEDSNDDALSPPLPSNSTLGVFSDAAVVSLGSPCADIGKSMLDAGGNAVDAAIASMLCDGVCVMQSMGVGGGFLMTLYNKSEGKTYSLIARETAPAAATRDMFVNDTSASQFGDPSVYFLSRSHSQIQMLFVISKYEDIAHFACSSNNVNVGALAAAVPSELKGYQAAHERFGKLPWSDLFQPTIKLCEDGVPVNARLASNFLDKEEALRNSSTFMNVILNSTEGKMPKEGDLLKLPLLANTLRLIAESPNKAEELYNGSLTAQFVADIQAGGGIITEQDMNNYNVRWEEPYSTSVSGNYTVYSAALPGSGILVTFMLRLLDGMLQFANSDTERSLYIIEAMKHAYGRRSGLGDAHFLNETYLNEVVQLLTNETEIMALRDKIKLGWTSNNYSYYGASYTTEDSGTDNNVVVDKQGNAISITSTINLYFGSKFVSTSTGIILNNQMDDFSTPGLTNYFGVKPSEANFIEPGKRPLSSMSPTVVIDSAGDVRLVVGGSGGTTITTQVTCVTIKNLWEGKNIKESIDERRFHHQLDPMTVTYEDGITKDEVSAWKEAGHSTLKKDNDYLAVITGIARLGDSLTANCDWRKPGSVAGI